MTKQKKYNPEKRAWRGRSYKKGGTHVVALRVRDLTANDEQCKTADEPDTMNHVQEQATFEAA